MMDPASGFTDRNATTFMGRPSMYIDYVKEAGFKYMTWWDGSHHLERYFRNMLSQIHENRAEMNAKARLHTLILLLSNSFIFLFHFKTGFIGQSDPHRIAKFSPLPARRVPMRSPIGLSVVT